MNRIYVYPWDQLSKSAGEIAKGLDTSKLLRKGSRYKPQDGDVIVNWGASDIDKFINERVDARRDVQVLNQDVTGALDKVTFFIRLGNNLLTPAYELDRAVAEDTLKFPVLCRTKTKGCDGAGIVIAETKLDMVEAKLYVELEPKTAEYRVHIGRNRDGSTSIIGVQQKFLPNGVKDKRLRTTANGCYFVWTLKGEPIENVCPPKVLAVTKAAFDLFPELDFVGADVIWNEATGKASVIEFNSAPEMPPQSVERYVKFFQQFRQPEDKARRVDPRAGDPPIDPWKIEGPQQLDYAGEKLPVGVLRDEIPEDNRKPWEKAFYAQFDARHFGGPDEFAQFKRAFHAGWDARKGAELARVYGAVQQMDVEEAPEQQNYMYGRIDVV